MVVALGILSKSTKFELLNKRAARFITGNNTRVHGNTCKNMKALGWAPLSERRAKNKLILFYKTLNNQIHVPTEDLIHSKNPRRPFNFFVPQSSVDCHLYSFFPDTIRLWNSLPDDVKASDSITAFKSSVEKITIRLDPLTLVIQIRAVGWEKLKILIRAVGPNKSGGWPK